MHEGFAMTAYLPRNCSIVAAVCLCLPLMAVAQSPDRPQATPEYLHEMRYFDTNSDRQIDAEEFAAGQQLASMLLMLSWDACDLDGDDAVSFAEFRTAATAAMRTLLEADSESEQQAEDELARMLPLKLLLERLSEDGKYADEVAALREAIEDLDDDDAIITHIAAYPKLYPHITPILRTWYRYYPVKPGVRQHLRALPARAHPLKPKAKAAGQVKPKPKPKAGQTGAKRPRKHAGPAGKPKPKAGPKPKGGSKPKGGRQP
jgi:hypothetical protein